MDVLKALSFTVAIFVVGAAFILVGLLSSFTINGYSMSVHAVGIRALLVVLGTAFASIAIYAEIAGRKERWSKMHVSNEGYMSTTPNTEVGSGTKGFLYTLDEIPANGFSRMIQGASRLSILGRTAVNLLGQYHKALEDLGRSGCEVRLLFTDPSSQACHFLYGSNPEIYRNNVLIVAQHLKRLKPIMGGQLQVRITKHAPTQGLIVVEKQDPQECFLTVQLYFLHGATGRDRPIFRVQHSERWYKLFRDEFDQLCKGSLEWSDASK